ncbi:MAG: RluA family pseudouridine synthase [Firmicutes bacterium HGW-Firmicutes-21]|nr:MAG: RluA family pseudouridine synthase [Firmicutes bacterium HGW-Firmicutes-21]
MQTIEINKNDGGQRLDKFLTKRFKNMPLSLMYKYIRTKRIKLNGKKAKENTLLAEGDILTLYIGDEFFEKGRNDDAFMRIKPKLDIVYEDTNILVVNKPAGLIVHSDINEEFNTLINHITAYLYAAGSYNPEVENSFAPSLCNRIDRNTQGLVVAAKNAAALKEMNDIIKNREVEKRYLAAVHGVPKEKNGTIDSFLYKDNDRNLVTVKQKKNSVQDRRSVTKYTVIDTNKEKTLSLLEIELITGRTHQIRAQMSYIGHPLLGDGKYSDNKADRKNGYSHQALCSYSLLFTLRTEKVLLGYLDGLYLTAPKPEFLKLFR